MPQDSNAGKSVVGAWDLVSLSHYRGDTFRVFPLGEGAKGRILYSDTGYMCAFLMRADWAERDSVDPADNMLSYSGRWNVEGDRVYHQVDFSNNSSYIGRRLMRLVEWQENGDILLYSGDPAAAHRRLVWTRARD